MKKTISGKEYDTAKAVMLCQVTAGNFGEPGGYEETLYQANAGHYFLYVNGGETSPHPKEDIKRMSNTAAEQWLNDHQ